MHARPANEGDRRRIVPSPANGSWRREKSAEEIHEQNRLAAKQALFVVKKHDATRLRYDLRLGHNGVLLSWALPEGPSCCSGYEREAVRVPNHDRENAFFEGCIEEGYGAGIVMLWDWGIWEALPGYTNVDRALRRGELKFLLRGEKLKGKWTLRRVSGYDGNRRNPHWVLTKAVDAFARTAPAKSILDEAPYSVSTERTLAEIEDDWRRGRSGASELQGKLFEG